MSSRRNLKLHVAVEPRFKADWIFRTTQQNQLLAVSTASITNLVPWCWWRPPTPYPVYPAEPPSAPSPRTEPRPASNRTFWDKNPPQFGKTDPETWTSSRPSPSWTSASSVFFFLFVERSERSSGFTAAPYWPFPSNTWVFKFVIDSKTINKRIRIITNSYFNTDWLLMKPALITEINCKQHKIIIKNWIIKKYIHLKMFTTIHYMYQ